ncbi:O-antigen ligase family protein [Flavobacterium sp. N1736]|uniref:O-antigen ligase family protein n=1 Tax=Flavobacterium sp. N1736 TaxID=2986823 RepID=UPI002224E696|nr:O-antigen ligase family protein [Flavobacterium sp. N1736]
MKIQKITCYLLILLALSLFSCKIELLPFLKGKYIYWLIASTFGSLFLLVNLQKQPYKLNYFDIIVLILTSIGLLNFIYLSNATIYNVTIWYYFGYLMLYITLRQKLFGKEVIQKNLRFVLYFISITALLNVIIAVLQNIYILHSSNEYFSSTGLFFSPNQLGIYLALGLISTFEILRNATKKSIRIILCITLIVLLYGLYLSECRGAYLGVSAAILFRLYIVRQKIKNYSKPKLSAAILLITLALFLIIGNTNSVKSESVSGRMFIIKQTFEQIMKNPLAGYGIDSFSLKYNAAKANYFATERPWNEIKNASYIYSANNDFIELAFEFGILWMLIFTYLIIRLLSYSLQSTETQTCALILICLLFFALTNSILSVPLFLIIGCYCFVNIINLIDNKPIYTFNNYVFFQIGIVVIPCLFLAIIFLRLNAEYKLLDYYNGKRHFTSLKNIESYITRIDAKGEEFFMTGGVLLKNKYPSEGIHYLAKGFEYSGKPSLGKILAGFYQKQGKYNEAEKIYLYNMNVEPFRYDANMDLFRLYVKTNHEAKAREMAFRIIHLPIKIPSEKINDYKKEAILYLRKTKK